MPKVRGLPPGAIFWVKPGLARPKDPLIHPYALLASLEESGTFVYGSSSDTFARAGAHYRLLSPNQVNGLSAETYFYASALGEIVLEKLPARASGELGSDLETVRAAVREAIGYRTGPGYALGSASTSVRGRIVCGTTEHEAVFETQYFVILTEHAYSAQRKHQILVPLFPADEWEADEQFRSIDAPPWASSLYKRDIKAVLVTGAGAHSVWHDDSIHTTTRYSLDASHLGEIEDDVCAALGV